MTTQHTPTVVYEWDVETQTDGESEGFEDGEVLDHDFRDNYAQCLEIASGTPEPGQKFVIVLVRDSLRGFCGRAWAYVENGKLPEYFTDADGADDAKVPQKFHSEVARAALAKVQA